MSSNPHDPLASPRTLSGKYLVVELAGERYGLRVLRVREVLGRKQIEPRPESSEHVTGTLEIGGEQLPVLDLRQLRDVDPPQDASSGFALVLELPNGSPFEYAWVGCLVDDVGSVVDVSAADVEKARDEYALGQVRHDGEALTLLDVDAIVAATGVLEPPAGDVSTPAA